MKKPRILAVDIETAPVLAHVWKLWDVTVGLNQIESDWHLLSWSAKWLGDPPSKTMYMDQRNATNIEDDSKILKALWKLLDEADIILSQNGKAFDQKKIQARFVLSGMQPPSSYRHIDTRLLAKKHFGFTSNKLEYMSDKLCKKYKKLKTTEFQGFELWKECLNGNLRAWKEMEKYNKHDVLALEELYTKLIPWDNSVNFSVYSDDELLNTCTCGADKPPVKNGYTYTNVAKYQRYKCMDCGSETRGRTNLLTKEKRKSLNTGTNR